MVARVASFEKVNVEVAEKTMAQAEAIISPLMEGLPGYEGHLELVAPDGKVLSIALFDSEENARAAEPTFDEEMPRQLGDLFKAGKAAASPLSATKSSPTRWRVRSR